MATQETVKIFGGKKNFWLHTHSGGWDLTHPETPLSQPVYPRISLETTKGRVAIDPTRSALVVIDMQNYFLSPALGRSPTAVGMKVVSNLLEFVIPACRKAGILIVWLGWGLTDQDIEAMPPAVTRGFDADTNVAIPRCLPGLGSDIGEVEVDNGAVVQAGRILIKDEWNTFLYEPLRSELREQDVHIYKNRLSGFWGGTDIEEVLKARNIKSLIFSGIKPDQCVGGSIQDAFARGWDCLMLSDGCATTSPDFAQKCIEFGTENSWGFVLTCEELFKGVQNMETSP